MVCVTKKVSARSKAIIGLVIALITSSSAAIAQAPPETLEKARKLGVLNLKKGEVPAYLKIPNLHMSQTAPTNFPVDVYRSNIVSTNFVNTTAGAPTATLSIVTKDSPSTVNSFYQSALRSRSFALQIPKEEMLAKIGPPGSAFMMQGTRAKERISVSIVGRTDGNTYVSVNWTILP